MAFNPYLGRSQADLESDLQKAQADLAAGKTVSRATVPGIDVTNQIEFTIIDRIRLILKALTILDPNTYPPEQTAQASTTRIAFSTTQTTN